jgi:hypothetical protein
MSSYHIQHFDANNVWPKGGWSVYQITGDEIAARVVRDKDGKVIERHSWCGYLGISETWEGVLALIQDGRSETTRQMASGSRRKIGGAKPIINSKTGNPVTIADVAARFK